MSEAVDPPVRVLVVDDHLMFAESLAALLGREEGLTVVGVAADGAGAMDMVRRLGPDVVLVDYELPGADGVDVAAQIKRFNPAIMAVMLTGRDDDRTLVAAIEAGCSGFLTKDRAAAEVVAAVHAAAQGEALISPAMLARLLPKLSRQAGPAGSELTDREREILVLMATGSASKTIAVQLHLSVNTVRNHVQSVLNKLGAHSKLEAVATAVRTRIIDYPAA